MAFCFDLYGSTPYGLVKCRHTKCRPSSFLVFWIALQIRVACSKHSGNPGILALWTDVLIYIFQSELCHLPSQHSKEYFAFNIEQRYWPELWQGWGFHYFKDMDSISHKLTLTKHHLLPCHPRKSPENSQNWWALLNQRVSDTIDPRCTIVSDFPDTAPYLSHFMSEIKWFRWPCRSNEVFYVLWGNQRI